MTLPKPTGRARSRRIKVLIVDDSAMVRNLLSELLSEDPLIEVVGAAADAYAAREKIKALRPDVLTLDVEMPRMDGIQFLRNLMRLHPIPVVMCSALTARNADVTLLALEIGAVDFVLKPRSDVAHTITRTAAELIEKIKIAAQARLRAAGSRIPRTPARQVADADPAATLRPRAPKFDGTLPEPPTRRVVAIGASTGGTEAIRAVLGSMPGDAPGIVIAQHLPAAFVAPFVQRIRRATAMEVHEAQDGQLIETGHVYVAPGARHLQVDRSARGYTCRVIDTAPHNYHRPSVDLLFRSLARAAGAEAIGVLLTGMGADGAEGMKELRGAGARTVAQDERSSVVWGMPGAAVQNGAAEAVKPLEDIASTIMGWHAEATLPPDGMERA
jgi:two-component system chemotaxis response regulator CheB